MERALKRKGVVVSRKRIAVMLDEMGLKGERTAEAVRGMARRDFH
jgi:hypothetical protein